MVDYLIEPSFTDKIIGPELRTCSSCEHINWGNVIAIVT